jgi:hypothetical protein
VVVEQQDPYRVTDPWGLGVRSRVWHDG